METSDYRSIPPQSATPTTSPASPGASRMTYAKATQHVQFPTKEQAIVMDAMDGITIKEYTIAIGKIVSPENIRFVSRISNNRVCIYLSSESLVDTLTVPNCSVRLGKHILRIRPLISKAKRVIISNVCPVIPHSIIEEKLKEFNRSPVSQITFVKAGMNDPEYAHMMCFRRQFYLNPDDVNKLPESIKIDFQGISYWI